MTQESISIDKTPLCVDLDGTLIKLDTLHQAILLLIRQKPSTLFLLPQWIRKGRAFTKNEVARRQSLNVKNLPYNNKLLSYIKSEKNKGRTIILVTASNYRTAEAVSKHLGCFDEVLSSSESMNLFGSVKRDILKEKYKTFDYAGDSISDLPIWAASRKKILVNPSRKTLKKQSSDLLIVDKDPVSQSIPKTLRVHQWIKNLLLFLPILLAHQLNTTFLITDAVFAFLAFSLAASAIYIINDLFDLEADQSHPRKKYRPFAAGNIQIIQGVFFSPLLLIGSIILSSFLPLSFLYIIFLYILLTSVYSVYFKQLFGWDVIILTILYNMRIIAGGSVTNTSISLWLLIFSILFFLALALVKRCIELKELSSNYRSNSNQRGRGYKVTHYNLLYKVGVITSLSSIIVLIGYLLSNKVIQLYHSPFYLWLIIPLVAFWFLRLWKRVTQGNLHDDPLVFAITDTQTYITGILTILLVYFAL